MKPLITLLILLILILVVRHLWGRYTSRVERPAMQVTQSAGNIQLVSMPSHIVATVSTPGTLASASNEAFGQLAGYIFGDNTSVEKIAMTTPVTSQAIQGKKIAMTAPVTSQQIDTAMYETTFTMPQQWTMDTLPQPNNKQVSLKKIPESKKAVRSFDGYATQERVANQRDQFQKALAEESIQRSGSPTLAQYNDPRTPPRMRRNELWVDLTQER